MGQDSFHLRKVIRTSKINPQKISQSLPSPIAHHTVVGKEYSTPIFPTFVSSLPHRIVPQPFETGGREVSHEPPTSSNNLRSLYFLGIHNVLRLSNGGSNIDYASSHTQPSGVQCELASASDACSQGVNGYNSTPGGLSDSNENVERRLPEHTT